MQLVLVMVRFLKMGKITLILLFLLHNLIKQVGVILALLIWRII